MAKTNIDNYKLTLKDGRTLASLNDLQRALNHMSDDIFFEHVNENRNDFYYWVKDVFKNNKLAEDLLECTNREAALFCLKNNIDSKQNSIILDNPKFTLSLLKELPSLEFGNPLTNDKITDNVKKGYKRILLKDVNQSKPLVTILNIDEIKKISLKKSKTSKVLKEEDNIFNLAQIQNIKVISPKQIIDILKGVHNIE